MNNLYRVEYKCVAYVYAENEEEAKDAADYDVLHEEKTVTGVEQVEVIEVSSLEEEGYE